MKKLIITFNVLFMILLYGHSQTNVSGGIFTNTTWTFANSPYIVTDTVIVFPGITLTIEPGVTIKFNNGKLLEVRGFLNAIGTITDTIFFTSNSVSPIKGIWGGIKILNFTNIKWWKVMYSEGVKCGLGSPDDSFVNCSNSVFTSNVIGLSAYARNSKIDSCYFERNDKGAFCGTYERLYINNSIFLNNLYGINGMTSIKNSIICGNSIAGIYSFTGVISVQESIIINNNIGIDGKTCAFDSILNNVIYHNNIGIKSNIYNSAISNNKICKNYQYNLEHYSSNNMDFTNNCWCEQDSISISKTIYDGYDNLNLGLININSFSFCDSSIFPIFSFCNDFNSNNSINLISTPKHSISIYPNPFSITATILSNIFLNNATLKVFNIYGQIIVQIDNINSNSISINRNNLPNGIYLLNLTEENKLIAQEKIFIIEN